MRDRRYEEPSVVLERDEATVEEMVYRRGQQKAVFSVQALVVAAVTPRFAVARAKMLRSIDTSDTTGGLDGLNSLAEEPLASARNNEGFAISLRDRRILLDAASEMLLPEDQLRPRSVQLRFGHNLLPRERENLGTDELS
jgi:hypothetical protein